MFYCTAQLKHNCIIKFSHFTNFMLSMCRCSFLSTEVVIFIAIGLLTYNKHDYYYDVTHSQANTTSYVSYRYNKQTRLVSVYV